MLLKFPHIFAPLINTILLNTINQISTQLISKDFTFVLISLIFLMYIVIAITFIIALIAIVFFLRKFLPYLKLFYIRVFFGKYSYNFLRFINKKGFRNPHKSCIDDKITWHFRSFFREKAEGAPNFQTSIQINFEDTPFLLTHKQIIQSRRKPDCVNFTLRKNYSLTIYGYNEHLGNCRIRCLYYFFIDSFVMGEYVFLDVPDTLPDEIIYSLTSKFLEGQSITADNFFITDDSGNMIQYLNYGFNIIVRFIGLGDSKTRDILSSTRFGINSNPEQQN